MVSPKKISEFKPILTNVAQTSHYQVFFDGLSPSLFSFLGNKNVDRRFITDNSGLLCSSASIPGSALATSDIFGNFTGVQEKFAHTRIFSEMSLEFYVDKDYKMIKFFEHWMDYISSGANQDVEQDHRAFYRRFRYPDSYKCNTMYINKFEKNYKRTIRYRFVNIFPKSIDPISISYGASDILKVTVNFQL